jgi:hypothetical protein
MGAAWRLASRDNRPRVVSEVEWLQLAPKRRIWERRPLTVGWAWKVAFFKKNQMLCFASGSCACSGGFGKKPARWHGVQRSTLLCHYSDSEDTCQCELSRTEEDGVRYGCMDLCRALPDIRVERLG